MWNRHPSQVCMTYFTHMAWSLQLCGRFACASVQALIHAFFPFWCITSSTDHVKKITMLLESSGCKKTFFSTP
jgi:hypothetical protein